VFELKTEEIKEMRKIEELNPHLVGLTGSGKSRSSIPYLHAIECGKG